MERDQPLGPEHSQQFTSGRIFEMEAVPAIDSLPEVLGLVETQELIDLRQQVVEALRAGSVVTEIATRYHLLAEEVVNQQEGPAFARAQIGLIVQMGLIHRAGGNAEDYQVELEDALTYAENMGFDDITLVVQEAITAHHDVVRGYTETHLERPTSQRVAEACSEVLDESAIDGLRALGLDDEDFLMAIYAELVSAGIDDPEEFLRRKGILEG